MRHQARDCPYSRRLLAVRVLPLIAARSSRPSTSRVLRETNSENVPTTTNKSEADVLPRHKTVDEVTKVAEARLKDLRQDKYMLLNEREDLKTEIRTHD